MVPDPDDTSVAVDHTVPETPEALKDAANSPVVSTPALQTPSLHQASDLYQYSSPMISEVSNSFAKSNILSKVEEGLLIDFGDTPLVDPATAIAQPIHCHLNKLDLLFDDLEIPNLLPCPVTLPDSPVASSTAIYQDARQSSMANFSTTVPSQTPPPFTPSTNLAAIEMASYRPRTRVERATEPHTATKPNWALAPSIQRPIFTKEPRSVHFKANSPLPKHTHSPSQAPSGLNLVTHGPASTNDCSPALLVRPMAAPPPHGASETPLSKPPAPSIHPSRLRLLQGSGATSEAGFDPLETKKHITKGSLNGQITGANVVPVARMRTWGARATDDAGTRTSASGNVGEKGAMGIRPPPYPSATFDAVPMGRKTVTSTQFTVQTATLPPSNRQTRSVTVESEDEGAADRAATSPPPRISHIDKSSGQKADHTPLDTPIPSFSGASLVRPSALKKRAVVEYSYAQSNPFIDPEPAQEPVSIAKPRPPLLQRMGIGSRVGPSALAARQQLFIEEDGRTCDRFDQCIDEEAYEEYEEEGHWTPLPWARATKLVIAEPVGREESHGHTFPMRTPTEEAVRIVEPGPPSQIQTRRTVIHHQEGEQGEEYEYGLTYGLYPEEDLHIRTAASRRIPVSQAEDNPPPQVFAHMQQDSLRHAAGSRVRRVVIQAPLEADDVDQGVEKFRGLSVAGRVQTPGPRRHRVVKVHAQRLHHTCLLGAERAPLPKGFQTPP